MGIVIFDLFGTLIFKKKYEYDEALRWLADTYFEHRYKELKELSDEFKKDYIRKRKESYEESAFCEQLKLFERELNIKICDKYLLVEWMFMRRFREEKLFPEVIDLLSFLDCNGCKMYLLTNSMFSSSSIALYLDLLGIGKYFEKVYSSSDIGFRKPAKEAFNYVLHDLNIDNASDIYYIGDSYEKDYVGALEVGLKPILIVNNREIDGLRFDSLLSLLEYFRKNFC